MIALPLVSQYGRTGCDRVQCQRLARRDSLADRIPKDGRHGRNRQRGTGASRAVSVSDTDGITSALIGVDCGETQGRVGGARDRSAIELPLVSQRSAAGGAHAEGGAGAIRSEEHTSELQSRFDLVCRLLLEKKKNKAHI